MDTQTRFNQLYESFSRDGKLMHVHELLGRAATLWPTRTMVICDDESITYLELYSRSKLLAHKLREMGVHKGDRVVIYYENSIAFYVAYFAVWYAGAIVAPLNVFLHETELLRILKDAEPKVLFISPTLLKKVSHLSDLPLLISDIDTTSPLPKSTDLYDTEEEHQTFDGDETVAMLYTSGTTGFPKGVMLSSKNIMTNTLQGASSFAVDKNERIFCPLPLFHSLPQNICIWAVMVVGATAIIVPKIDRQALMKGIAHKPTIIVAVPALYGLFCLLRTLDFGKVKYFVAGGDALSDKIRCLFALVYGRKICNGYGLTETSPFISVDLADYTQPTSTIGRPFPGMKAEMRGEHGVAVAQGEIGTLWVSGDNVMKGYYNAPEATQAVIQNGWLNTGDLGYFSSEGKIVLVGRERDLISNKGLKIYPQEVENILLTHTQVMQAAVIGVKDNETEIPVAFIGTRASESEHPALIDDIRDLCQRNLAPYKVPRQFYLRKELPLSPTGKVNKNDLRKELASKND